MNSILAKANEYIKWDPNPITRAEVKQLINANDEINLQKMFGSRIAFGTAGLRAKMAPGYACMNDLVILQTSQGLVEYISNIQGEQAKHCGVVIGYDHRSSGSLSSKRFADVCAAVFISKGFKVYILNNFVATPILAFAISYLKCCAGFMVTASHNPACDNGFKM